MTAPEQIGSIHRYNPLPGKPHIFFDKCWQYNLPGACRWNYGNAVYQAYQFVKRLNKQRNLRR